MVINCRQEGKEVVPVRQVSSRGQKPVQQVKSWSQTCMKTTVYVCWYSSVTYSVFTTIDEAVYRKVDCNNRHPWHLQRTGATTVYRETSSH